jgi:hypothetical protein
VSDNETEGALDAKINQWRYTQMRILWGGVLANYIVNDRDGP